MAPSLYRVIVPTDDMPASDRFWSTLLGLEVDPVVPRYDIYSKWGDWINQKWTEMVTA